MAWTEQCKVAFHANCCAKLGRFRNKNRKLRGILRELSQESDIPWRTLERWWYEQTNPESIPRKNEGDKNLSKNGGKTEAPKPPSANKIIKELNPHFTAISKIIRQAHKEKVWDHELRSAFTKKAHKIVRLVLTF